MMASKAKKQVGEPVKSSVTKNVAAIVPIVEKEDTRNLLDFSDDDVDVNDDEVDESMIEFDSNDTQQAPFDQVDLSSISSKSKSSTSKSSNSSLQSNKTLMKENAIILEDKLSLVDLKIGKHTTLFIIRFLALSL